MRYQYVLLSLIALANGLSISEINGHGFTSPYVNTTVNGISALVTIRKAKDPQFGFWVESIPTTDSRNTIFLRLGENDDLLSVVKSGDIIQFSAKVEEVFHSPSWPSDPDVISNTELTSPFDLTVVSKGNPLPEPIIVGAQGLHPPTQKYTALDGSNIFTTQQEAKSVVQENPTLSPSEYGLDFWESLMGKLVTITKPVGIASHFFVSDVWVRGDWPATGVNKLGGLTVTTASDGSVDFNPEAILILDPTADVRSFPIGTTFKDITGVVDYRDGSYVIDPLDTPVVDVLNNQIPNPNSLLITKENSKCSLTFSDYNLGSLSVDRLPELSHTALIFARFLGTPDVVFLQEVPDDSYFKDIGIVTSNKTLDTFLKIVEKSTGKIYDYAYVTPQDKMDTKGGDPMNTVNENERPVFLYRKDRVRLVDPHPGGAEDATQVTTANGKLGLSFNPGRIDPSNPTWNHAAKPLVAHFEMIESKERFFAVNVHEGERLTSFNLHWNHRPPLNYEPETRADHIKVISKFVKSILDLDSNASVIVAGNFNEIIQNTAVFSSLATDLPMVSTDEVAGIPPEERYTCPYAYGHNSAQLDYAFISPKLRAGGVEVEHVRLNNWVEWIGNAHDPSVSRVKLC